MMRQRTPMNNLSLPIHRSVFVQESTLITSPCLPPPKPPLSPPSSSKCVSSKSSSSLPVSQQASPTAPSAGPTAPLSSSAGPSQTHSVSRHKTTATSLWRPRLHLLPVQLQHLHPQLPVSSSSIPLLKFVEKEANTNSLPSMPWPPTSSNQLVHLNQHADQHEHDD